MSGSSSAMPSGLKSSNPGNRCGLRSARNQLLSSTRCLIERTTDGLALANCMLLAEFDDVARRDAARRAVIEIAVDDRPQFWGRQRVVSAHQILDLEPSVLADGLQRGDRMGDRFLIRERQQ